MAVKAELKKEIAHYENFFSRMGFKSIDGAVFGLLSFSEEPLSSDEIEKELSLSQAAVSLSLKSLTQMGAIETLTLRDLIEHDKDSFDQGENKFEGSDLRRKFHRAKVDSLNIVASVFRKREEEYIRELKKMAIRVLHHENQSASIVAKRMQSIISTSDLALKVLHYIFELSHIDSRTPEDFGRFTKRAFQQDFIKDTVTDLKNKLNPIQILKNKSTSPLKKMSEKEFHDSIKN